MPRPIFTATPGSTHGYDVANFAEIDPVIGGRPPSRPFAALKEQGLGPHRRFRPQPHGGEPVQSVVAEHPGMGPGQRLPRAFRHRLVGAANCSSPVLGQPYGQALGDGLFGLKLDERDGGISFTYYDNHLPLTPPSYARS
jgi:(1->4)-alpha-D-glucan 1-alpha-D-glucosylmutase